MMQTKNLIIICITLLIAGILFWPTLYRYDKVSVMRGRSLLVRVNRLTGYTEFLGRSGWVPVGKVGRKKVRNIPYEEWSKITGKASLSDGIFKGEIYNGSNWKITSITVRIVAKEKDGRIRWDRKFKKEISIDPLSTSSFSISVIDDEGIGSFDWYIVDMSGYKSNS